MKHLVITIFVLISGFGLGQIEDKTFKSIRFSGISGSFGFTNNKYLGVTTNQLKPIFTQDLSLNQNYENDYDYVPYFFQTNGLSSLQLEFKSYFELNKIKKVSVEAFAGIRFANTTIAGGFYNQKNPLIDNEIFQSPNSNNYVEKQSTTKLLASYGIYGNTFFIPMGLNLNTKKSRIIWLNAGIELSPGLTVNKVYESLIIESKQTKYTENGVVQQGFNGIYSFEQRTLHQYSENISKPSFMFTTSLPLGLNIRLGKRKPVLKNTSLMFLISPNWTYGNISYLGSIQGFGMQSNLGLNLRW